MKILSFLEKTETSLANIIFPFSCIGCGCEELLLCEKCKKSFEYLSAQNCPICEKAITLSGEKCSLCKKEKFIALDKLVVAGEYDNELTSKLIHLYKYKFIHDLAEPIGEYMTESIKKWSPHGFDLIIPVPLHKRRLRWRGFNQASLLAKYICQNLTPQMEIPLNEEIILRTKNTTPQMKLKNQKQRQENISGAFALNKSAKSLSGKNILLVDDVCTTGSTLMECAKELKKLRPRSITAVVFARQG